MKKNPFGKKRVKEILKIIDGRQLLDFVLYPGIFAISVFAKPFCKDVWIVEENPNEACDNGYIFYKYLRENRQDINAFYVINKKSKDYKKVEKYGNVISHGSLKHWIYYLNAKKIIVTQKYSNPSLALFYLLHAKKIIKTPRIFLQHGIIKDDCKLYYYNRTGFRLFICGAKREYEFVKNTFEYPEGYVAYTGLARYDNLNFESKNTNKLILVMPTWRNWIKKQSDFDAFINKYYEILRDEGLVKHLRDTNTRLKFVLHKNMKKFELNKSYGFDDVITINHNEEVNIQDLLNEADLLVTDFSSVFFDIAYRKRPIIYYQFDTKEYRENQLQDGYFSYKDDGFGDVYDNAKDVIDKVVHYIDNDYSIEEKYIVRMEDFFERKDKDNCKRILEEIEKI